MAKKNLGYVELEWRCPVCDTRNPGSQRVCTSCGAPQPDNVQFDAPAQAETITDPSKIAQAKAAPDVHCPYCGARNPADAKVCHQCGGNLEVAAKRGAGRTVGALNTTPRPDVRCTTCGTDNPAGARVCKNCGAPLPLPAAAPPAAPAAPARSGPSIGCLTIGIGIAIAAVLAIALFFWWGKSRSSTLDAIAVSPHWTTSITVLGLAPVEYSAWSDQTPDDAEVLSCREEVRDVVDQAVPNSREVCGTPYIVDKGTGYGEVVQDCRYEVLDNLCQYRVLEWRPVDTLVREGVGISPQWPAPELRGDTKEADRSATYECVLRAGDKEYAYRVGDADALAACQEGSHWRVEIDGFGGLVNAEPVPQD